MKNELRQTGDRRRSLSRATSEDGVPTELLETINIFCSLGAAIFVVLNRLVALGVGDLEFLGVAPVCIIRGILVSF